jgi:hypothetical protein
MMPNIASEYATLPMRLAESDMGSSVRERADHLESRSDIGFDTQRTFVARKVTKRKISHSEL